ncbi:MAG: acetate/propionate family kinase [Cocleimonas sp.]
MDVILIVNSGSSSLKFALYPATDNQAEVLLSGVVSGIGVRPKLTAKMAGESLAVEPPFNDIAKDATHASLIKELLERLHTKYSEFNPIAVGHRIVHGGSHFTKPTIITPESLEQLKRLIPLAPLHQPHSIVAIEAIATNAPELLQVACFDTSFHRTQSKIEQMFAIPRALTEEGIIRYGFHGLSYEYIASVLPQYLGDKADGRVLVAHLGNGTSMCAMKNRKSVSSTMGFSTLEGLVMGTRCGLLDAGVILHLIKEKGLSVDEVQKMLYHESGLLGVSGISSDMRDLQKSDHPDAKQAIELFCHRAKEEIGNLTAVMHGLDAIVFTAGIGENSPPVREQICESLEWLGVKLDKNANNNSETKISAADSKIDVYVIPTDEEATIAKATRDFL